MKRLIGFKRSIFKKEDDRTNTESKATERATLLVAAWTGTLFGLLGQISKATALAVIPIALWEFSLGIYLVVKGFKPSALLNI